MIGRNRVLTHYVKILIRPSLIALLIKENFESYIVLFKFSADWAGILCRDKVYFALVLSGGTVSHLGSFSNPQLIYDQHQDSDVR